MKPESIHRSKALCQVSLAIAATSSLGGVQVGLKLKPWHRLHLLLAPGLQQARELHGLQPEADGRPASWRFVTVPSGYGNSNANNDLVERDRPELPDRGTVRTYDTWTVLGRWLSCVAESSVVWSRLIQDPDPATESGVTLGAAGPSSAK